MKVTNSLVISVMALAFAFLGCKKEDGKVSIDTAAIEKAFASSEPALKDSANKAVEAVKKADFNGALSELKSLAANAKLSDEQKKIVNDFIAQVQKAISDGVAKATEGAKQAIGDAQKTLGK